MEPLPRYWARREDRVTVPLETGPEVWDLVTYGSSSDSQADAQREADERFAAFMTAGGDVHGDWYYPLRHAPEEILREIHDGEDLIGVVTRNRYGVEVLNTDALLIADVDLAQSFASRATEYLLRDWHARARSAPQVHEIRPGPLLLRNVPLPEREEEEKSV